MADYSMYETLMGLPLFSGANCEIITSFIEKSHLEFNIYNPGEEAVAYRSRCRTLKCLLSGLMEISYPLCHGEIVVREVAVPGRFLGFERLFGLENRYPFSARAVNRCGTLDITKAQYLNLLKQSEICMMNCLNYLSRKAQLSSDTGVGSSPASLGTFLAQITSSTTARNSLSVTVETPGGSLGDFFRHLAPDYERELAILADNGAIKCIDEKKLEISDRELLIDFDI